MSYVMQKISKIKQLRGICIKLPQFESKILDDGKNLFEEKNISDIFVDLTVNHLTRLLVGANNAFCTSIWGAEYASFFVPEALDIALELESNIKGIDDDLSIINAYKLVTFDMWYMEEDEAVKFWLNYNNKYQKSSGIYTIHNTFKKIIKNMHDPSIFDFNEAYELSMWMKNISDAFESFYNSNNIGSNNPDIYTIKNIQVMVQRGINFWKGYEPIVKNGFEFKKKAYTNTVNIGYGDFLTADTMWDFKVSKTKPTSKHTLQLLMYWIMGQHSGEKEFKNITNLGIFNPRLNTVYTLPISKIERETIKTVEKEVIGY